MQHPPADSFGEDSYAPDETAQLRDRLFLAPRDCVAMERLAHLLEISGDPSGAIDLYQRALRVDPYQLTILLSLGRIWGDLGDSNRATQWLTRALSVAPGCEEAAARLAALDGAQALTPLFVKTLFDQYADHFDENLTVTLDYRAPALVAATIGRHVADDAQSDILDLGCGTGLSGQALRPFARTLDGVDLSPRMIEKAQARGIYTSVSTAEVQDYLTVARQQWDIIAAVDMLNYIGDLTPIFSAVAARMRPNGLWAGTIERGEEGKVTLAASRRYTHGRDHLIEAIRQAGFQLEEISEAALRKDRGVPVPGFVFIARIGA